MCSLLWLYTAGGSSKVRQPYQGSFEIIHDPIRQAHQNPRVPDHVGLEIHYTKASQPYQNNHY